MDGNHQRSGGHEASGEGTPAGDLARWLEGTHADAVERQPERYSEFATPSGIPLEGVVVRRRSVRLRQEWR